MENPYGESLLQLYANGGGADLVGGVPAGHEGAGDEGAARNQRDGVQADQTGWHYLFGGVSRCILALDMRVPRNQRDGGVQADQTRVASSL